MNRIIKTLATVALAICAGCILWEGGEVATEKYVDEFDLSRQSCGLGKRIRARKSVDGHLLSISKRSYLRGFGAAPESAVAFIANGKVAAFDAEVGVDDDSKEVRHSKSRAIVGFRVWADGKIAYDSGEVAEGVTPKMVHVELKGAREIVLETVSNEKWVALDSCNSDWGNARFTLEKGAKLEIVDDVNAFRQLGILTPPESPKPRFNGADIWGVRPGHPIIFRVPITGVKPMKLSAKGLPVGVTFDAQKGILGGVAPKSKGNYDITITAENSAGQASRVIRLAVGDTIGLTPPLGWNSWNTLCYRLTADKAKAAALALEKSGLGDHGWAYINLDDWWMMNNTPDCQRVEMRKNDFGGREDVRGPARDADGKVLSNRSFPNMKELTDYIHSFGFKAGIYSSPGPITCGQCEGSYQHERQDAERWAEWGFDYVKYDWCSYGRIFDKEHPGVGYYKESSWKDMSLRESYIKPYRLMGGYLKNLNRDIFYSLCQYGMAETEIWGRSIGANSYRSWGDLKDGWTWTEKAIDSRINGEYWRYTGPGFWADPDMMIVGQQYSFGYDHPSFLTPNEQYTHVSIWAMVCSPMLIGCDLTTMDDFTRSLLVNDEVIDISQDRLGRPARRYRHTDTESVWARPLANGDWAVALVNRYPLARSVKVKLEEIGLGGAFAVRDCWSQSDEGEVTETYEVEIPPHATKLVRLHRIDCLKCR